MKKSFYLALAASCLLFGCIQSIRLSSERVDSAKKIGIVAIADDKFILKHVGTTVFADSINEFVSPWQFNNDIKDAIRSELSNSPYIIIDITYDVQDLQKKAHSRTYVLTGTYPTYDLKPIREDLKKIARDSGVDTLIVVTSHFEKDYIERTDQQLKGCGLYNRSFLGYERTYLHCVNMMSIIDGKTGELLALRPMGFYNKIENTFWKTDISLLSEEERAFIERTVRERMRDAAKSSLSRIGLIACLKDDFYCAQPVSEQR